MKSWGITANSSVEEIWLYFLLTYMVSNRAPLLKAFLWMYSILLFSRYLYIYKSRHDVFHKDATCISHIVCSNNIPLNVFASNLLILLSASASVFNLSTMLNASLASTSMPQLVAELQWLIQQMLIRDGNIYFAYFNPKTGSNMYSFNKAL